MQLKLDHFKLVLFLFLRICTTISILFGMGSNSGWNELHKLCVSIATIFISYFQSSLWNSLEMLCIVFFFSLLYLICIP